jgi:hypothetical protein
MFVLCLDDYVLPSFYVTPPILDIWNILESKMSSFMKELMLFDFIKRMKTMIIYNNWVLDCLITSILNSHIQPNINEGLM